MSERLQGSYRARIKTLRGLDSLESGQRYLDGWTLTYNHFRDHEGAGGEPPAVRAKVKLPYTEWADVVRGGVADPVERIQHKRISAIEEPEFRISLKPGATLPALHTAAGNGVLPANQPAAMLRPKLMCGFRVPKTAQTLKSNGTRHRPGGNYLLYTQKADFPSACLNPYPAGTHGSDLP